MIRNTIDEWVKETGGQVKQNAAIDTLTNEFSKRLVYPTRTDCVVRVYAEQPCMAAAAIYVSVELPDGTSTAMKIIQFMAAVRCPGGKRYEKWHICRPSEKLDLYMCPYGDYAREDEDYDLSSYVDPMIEYLTTRNANLQKCCQMLADTFGSDFLKELKTRDGKPLETYSHN